MSEQTLRLVQTIRGRLHATIQRMALADLAFGSVVTVGVLAAIWLLFTGAEAFFWMGSTMRTALFVTALGAGAALLTYYVVIPSLRLVGVLEGPSEKNVARQIGQTYPEVSDRLLNLIDLADGRSSDAPRPLLDRAIGMLASDLRSVSFEEVETFTAARRAGRVAAVPVVSLLLFFAAFPSTFLSASDRLLSPRQHFSPPAPFQFSITPGATTLVKGDSIQITVRAEGSQLPGQVTLALNNQDEEHIERIELSADADGRFSHKVANVRRAFRYRVSADPVTTPWYPVELTQRPLLRDLHVTLDFPDYTGIPSRNLAANVGDVKALPGTQIHIEAQTGGSPVETAYLRFDDDRRDTLQLQDRRAVGSFTLSREGQYQVILESQQGVSNRAPITYSLQLLADEPPSVALLAPGASASLDKSLQAGLRMRLSDDFGFSALRLYYRRAGGQQSDTEPQYERIDLPLDNPRQLSQEVIYNWVLGESTSLNLEAGDAVEYFVRVWDNDAVAGHKSARTALHTLRLPSLEEQYEQVDQQQQDTQSKVQDALQDVQQVQEQFDQLRDELRRKNSADWQDKRQLDQIRKKQQEVESKVEEATRQLESLTEEMERNNLVDDQTLNMYKELQRVMDEVNSPELKQALQKLQQALQNMSPQQMQQALQNAQFNRQQYKQRLQRAIDLFKKAKVQQELQEAARRAQELAEQQKQLAERTRQQMDEPTDREQPEASAASNQSKKAEQKDGNRRQSETSQDQQQSGQEGEQSASSEQRSPSAEPQQRDRSGQQRQPAEKLAQEQERASESMRELEKQLGQLQQEMDSIRSAPKRQMQQLQRQMQKRQLSKKMQQNSQQLRNNELQQAQQGQQQMQKQLQQMSQNLQQMQSGMQGQQRQMNMAGLRQVLSDVLTLSQQQEGLRLSVRGSDAQSPRLREYAQRQQQLSEGLGRVADSLQHLARNIPQMRREVQKQAGQAGQAMSRAVDQLTQRHSGRAAGHQKSSMMHLNELGLMLSDLLSQMQSSSSGSGNKSMQQLQQQLQQMAGQQQQLNKQIQQMLNDIQGNRLSMDQQKRLEQMAQQQQSIQRELQKLSRNREVRGKTLGDLQKVAEQMEQTINELRQHSVNPRTIDRQNKILNRLLDAQRSINQRKKSKQRKGTRGQDIQRESPGEVTPAEEAEQLRRALIRALENGYSPDYEELIKRYFDLLQQQDDEQGSPASGR